MQQALSLSQEIQSLTGSSGRQPKSQKSAKSASRKRGRGGRKPSQSGAEGVLRQSAASPFEVRSGVTGASDCGAEGEEVFISIIGDDDQAMLVGKDRAAEDVICISSERVSPQKEEVPATFSPRQLVQQFAQENRVDDKQDEFTIELNRCDAP